MPNLYLSPELVITDADDDYFQMTKTDRSIIGRKVFEVFPVVPDDPTTEGSKILRDSLARVLKTGKPDQMPTIRYDIEQEDGTWAVRYWEVFNTPVLGDGKVVQIVNSAQDVTVKVLQGHKRKLHRTYLFQNAFVGLVAVLLATTGISFFFDPDQIGRALPHVPPYDYFWYSLYVVGGVFVLYGLLSRRIAVEAAGHILYVPGLLANCIAAALVLGLHTTVLLTLIFALAAAFRAVGLMQGWQNE